MIKEQKRQGSQMASYVEKVLDFLEKLTKSSEVPKTLQEDVQWAYDIISANKLYAGSFEGFKLSEERPEIKAWTDMIALKNIPNNKLEMLRLKQYELNDKEKIEADKKMQMRKNSDTMRAKKRSEEMDESKMNLLNNSNMAMKGPELLALSKKKSTTMINPDLAMEVELDSDDEFL